MYLKWNLVLKLGQVYSNRCQNIVYLLKLDHILLKAVIFLLQRIWTREVVVTLLVYFFVLSKFMQGMQGLCTVSERAEGPTRCTMPGWRPRFCPWVMSESERRAYFVSCSVKKMCVYFWPAQYMTHLVLSSAANWGVRKSGCKDMCARKNGLVVGIRRIVKVPVQREGGVSELTQTITTVS